MKFRVLAVTAVAGALSLGAAACSSSGATTPTKSPKPSSSASTTPAATTSKPFGPACSAVPKSGAGSFAGMTSAPVATAASHNPVLSDLVKAVVAVKLVKPLNSAPALTVFAPDNSAFAMLPKATLAKVMANPAELKKILSYHVVSGRVTPAELATGKPLKTLEGSTVKPSKMGSTYEINSSQVVCGNVQTANATVYIINKVLSVPKG